MDEEMYTPDEIARLFRISKHTVYELIKRGELNAIKVGNKMRIEKSELERYKALRSTMPGRKEEIVAEQWNESLHIAGSHDFLVEHLIKYIAGQSDFLTVRPLFVGSLEGLLMLYRGQCDVACMHLFDPSTGEYNLPFIKMFFVLEPLTVVRLAGREQGLIIAKGNPKEIKGLHDLTRDDITFVNRQRGSGTRFLLDSFLAREKISPSDIKGYENEEWNHLSVAAQISNGKADCALGIRSAAEQLNLDFIPITKENFDLVLHWTPKNEQALKVLLDIIQLTSFKETVATLEGYDFEEFGKIIYSNRLEE